MVTPDSSQKSRDSHFGEMHFRTICFYPLSEPVVETSCLNCLRSGRVEREGQNPPFLFARLMDIITSHLYLVTRRV